MGCVLAGFGACLGPGKVGWRRVGGPGRRLAGRWGRVVFRPRQAGSAGRWEGGSTVVCPIAWVGTVETARWGWVRTGGRGALAARVEAGVGGGAGRSGRGALGAGDQVARFTQTVYTLWGQVASGWRRSELRVTRGTCARDARVNGVAGCAGIVGCWTPAEDAGMTETETERGQVCSGCVGGRGVVREAHHERGLRWD